MYDLYHSAKSVNTGKFDLFSEISYPLNQLKNSIMDDLLGYKMLDSEPLNSETLMSSKNSSEFPPHNTKPNSLIKSYL